MREKPLIAFTLAEVLITLGIIGIVASMTIPVIMQNIQDYQLKVAFKETFSILNQATKSIANDNGGTMKGVCAGASIPTDCYADTYAQYLKTQKVCYRGAFYGSCFVNTNADRFLDGAYITNGGHLALGGLLTTNNISIGFAVWDAALCASADNGRPNDVCARGWLDVNGLNQPNMLGKDIHQFYVLENSIVPSGSKDAWTGDTRGRDSTVYLMN